MLLTRSMIMGASNMACHAMKSSSVRPKHQSIKQLQKISMYCAGTICVPARLVASCPTAAVGGCGVGKVIMAAGQGMGKTPDIT